MGTVAASSPQIAELAEGTRSRRTERSRCQLFQGKLELWPNRRADPGPQPKPEGRLPAQRGRVCPGSSPRAGNRAWKASGSAVEGPVCTLPPCPVTRPEFIHQASQRDSQSPRNGAGNGALVPRTGQVLTDRSTEPTSGKRGVRGNSRCHVGSAVGPSCLVKPPCGCCCEDYFVEINS